ncbi:hypothetical protein M011DRAFT_87439 [Sporormia fimetaria CBS 119925]|uniref:Uncharacterized protein n=1 Tax=Sporormia fimetaria CBS 119925 TaxID=1340428 RepID=A0A6A6VBR2_9PLEO|nr:hypothetical protein M011DRAFT_87439 [Sporormia fimetaria CBS 119925]
MPSSQTRTKLKAFQFVDGAMSVDVKPPQPVRAIDVLSQKPDTTPKLVQPAAFPPPSTPATRLPLADLVGNEEESRRYTPNPNPSPEEQLCWRGSQPVDTPVPRKNRKRTRSSSPVTASPQDLPLQTARTEQETPIADPKMELWSRYTGNKGTPSANKVLNFARLINDDSPRSVTSAGDVSGLRRWASCGDEFPTSAAKRRRTKGAFRSGLGKTTDTTDDIFHVPSSDGVVQGQPEKSRLADLLHRMRDSMPPKPQSRETTADIPSSSSPLPDTTSRIAESTGSPLQQRHSRGHPSRVAEPAVVPMAVIQEEDSEQTLPGQSSGSSDEFGDHEFDTEMVEALDFAQSGQQASDANVTEPAQHLAPAEELNPQSEVTVAAPPVGNAGSDDEFGELELDDEFGLDDGMDFAADMEHVASLYDTRTDEVAKEPPFDSVIGAPVESAAADAVIDLDGDDSDEFGDDIDVDEFAAAEIVATQGYTI